MSALKKSTRTEEHLRRARPMQMCPLARRQACRRERPGEMVSTVTVCGKFFHKRARRVITDRSIVRNRPGRTDLRRTALPVDANAPADAGLRAKSNSERNGDSSPSGRADRKTRKALKRGCQISRRTAIVGTADISDIHRHDEVR